MFKTVMLGYIQGVQIQNYKLCVVPTRYSYVFHMILTTNNQQLPAQHLPIYLSNGSTLCSLWSPK